MALVPKAIVHRIQFYRTHIPYWNTHAEQIGTTPEAVADLQAKTQEALDAFNDQQVAQQKAESATLRLQNALNKMGSTGAGIIAHIRATAQTTGFNVYTLAQIPSPAARSRKPASGAAWKFATELLDDGALKLTWKIDNPKGTTGTVYQIMRKLDSGKFRFLATAGEKEYTDDAVPMGTKSILYKIRAIRGKTVGPWAIFPVSFGTVVNEDDVPQTYFQQKAA